MASVLICAIRGRIKILAHCALSCRPQIPRIPTDFSHTKSVWHSPCRWQPKRAESPMTSLAQGKRSDILGKPPHPITSRPARAKVNITRSASALFPLHGASSTAHYTQGAASLAAGLWTSAPSGRARLTACQTPSCGIQLHRTFRLQKIRVDPLRRRRIETQAVGSGARVNNPWKKTSVRFGAITFRWSVGLRRVSCFLIKQPARHLWKSAWSVGEHSRAACPIPNPTSHISHLTSHISHPTSHIPHLTSHIPHFTSHAPHSQHSSPKSTRFCPLRPAPRPNTPFSAHFRNRLTINHLPSKLSRATFQTRHSPPRNAMFRPSIPALSRLHPLPFAPRSLSPRNPIHAQRPHRPPLTAFPPVPFRLRTPKISTPRPLFHSKSRHKICAKYF